MRHFQESYPMIRQMTAQTSPLIRVRLIWTEIETTFYQKEQEKLEVLKFRLPWDKFLMAIPWKFRTDIFEIREEDILPLFNTNTDEK